MNKYSYKNVNLKRVIVFECLAGNILTADKMYKAKLGIDPVKQSYVAVSIEFQGRCKAMTLSR
jgi:hypothetical protein